MAQQFKIIGPYYFLKRQLGISKNTNRLIGYRYVQLFMSIATLLSNVNTESTLGIRL